MPKPRLLDLFCKAGGAGMGYHRAGFEVAGVDIEPQPNYPFEFHQADALDFPLDGFDVIHASPPCQRFSTQTKMHDPENHPDLLAGCRHRLAESGLPYVIENVQGAPLVDPIMICGSSFGWTELRRHRMFESNMELRTLGPCDHSIQSGGVISVTGNTGGSSRRDGSRKFGRKADWQRIMGIDWMTVSEMAQAIPPAYTEHIGNQLMKEVAHA